MSRFKRMNQNIKELWVKALRSGDFRQTIGAMRDYDYKGNPGSYCCLGVLQALVEPEHPEGANGSVPTASCLKASGLGRYRPYSEGVCGKLIELNDTRGASFKEIADFIEENL